MADYVSEFAELMPEESPQYRQGIGINVKRLLRLRGRLMALLFVGLAVPGLVLVWLLVPRQYVATAHIEFKATSPRIIGDDDRATSGTPAYESFVNTQIDLITGYPILSRVINDPEVKSMPAIRAMGDSALHDIRANLEADTEFRSELVTITYRHKDRQAAVDILNKILDKYQTYIVEQERAQASDRRQALAEKEEELREVLDRQRARITEMRKEIEVPIGNTPGMEPTETESFRINLAQAEADVTSARTQLRQAQRQVERAQNFLERYRKDPAEPIYALGVEQRVNEDPNVQLLIEQLAQVQREYSVLADTYVEGAPQLKVKRNELEAIESELEDVKAKARGQALRSLLAEHEFEVSVQESNLADAQERRDKFARLLEEYREESVGVSQSMAEIQELERRYEDTREYLRTIVDQMLTIELEAKAPARASILGSATAPGDPDWTERIRFMLVVIMGALAISVGTGLLLELTDQTIRSAEDIGFVTNNPVLAVVPDTSEDRLPSGVLAATVTEAFPGSMTADEFRRAITRVLYAGRRGGETQTFVVTSAVRGDGKTTLACNMALVLAQAERRVLLLDVDSRHPMVESSFGLQPGPGLAEILAGEDVEHDA